MDERMGRAYLGTLRAMELFNIDETRIYAMGNSGGGRSSHMLAYQYPELYLGAMPRCGANYPREVTRAYETQEPDSHYEFWGAADFPDVSGMPYLDYLRDLEPRYALMASFGDFREGDIMNIHHRGMEEDGLFSRLIETGGGHCSTNAAPELLEQGVRVLDDNRTIRIRWAEVDPDDPWSADEWSEAEGAVLTLARPGEASGSVAFRSLEVRDGVGLACE